MLHETVAGGDQAGQDHHGDQAIKLRATTQVERNQDAKADIGEVRECALQALVGPPETDQRRDRDCRRQQEDRSIDQGRNGKRHSGDTTPPGGAVCVPIGRRAWGRDLFECMDQRRCQHDHHNRAQRRRFIRLEVTG
jgi:hypothetical protein